MDASLVSGNPYVDSPPLLAKVDATYRLLAEEFAPQLVTGSPPADDLVARRWFDDRLAVARGVRRRTAVPEPTVGHEADERPLGHGLRLVGEPARTDWGRLHAGLFAEVLNPDDEDIALADAGATESSTILEALTLLDRYVPELAGAVLPHGGRVYLVTGTAAFESASDRLLPRAVYLSRHACSDAVRAAEALLHEATHQKLYDLQLIYTLYAQGYSPLTAPGIRPTWHPPHTRWPIDRVTAAGHVYVHLTRFYSALDADPPAGFDATAIRTTARQAHARGAMLLDALSAHEDQFNRHGRAFVDLLREVHAGPVVVHV